MWYQHSKIPVDLLQIPLMMESPGRSLCMFLPSLARHRQRALASRRDTVAASPILSVLVVLVVLLVPIVPATSATVTVAAASAGISTKVPTQKMIPEKETEKRNDPENQKIRAFCTKKESPKKKKAATSADGTRVESFAQAEPKAAPLGYDRSCSKKGVLKYRWRNAFPCHYWTVLRRFLKKELHQTRIAKSKRYINHTICTHQMTSHD